MHKPDLDIDALLALHRETFGDARMDATSDEADREAEEAAAAAELAAKAGDEGDDGDETDDDNDDADEKALGDAGKQALDRMKAKLKAERDKRRTAEAALAESSKPKAGDEPDADAIRSDATKAATAKANERILRSEVKAAATGKLADPADAFRFIDLSKFEVDDDGNVDEDEIAEAIADLVKNKPYLGVTQGDGKRFKGTADGGARGKPAAGKQQLTEADVERLSTAGKYAEIEQARLDGRLNDVLGIT